MSAQVDELKPFRVAEAYCYDAGAPNAAKNLRASVAALIAERDALREALEKIGRPQDCGCKPCTGRCRSQMALEIAIEEMQELARAALTTGESA